MLSYIGRQPLYYSNSVLYGYDLLHRDNVVKNDRNFSNKDEDLMRVFIDAVSVHRVDSLSPGLPVHFSFTRQLLMSNLPYILPPNKIVVELYGEKPIDKTMVARLTELRSAGYRLALGGYTFKNGPVSYNSVAHLFDIIYLNIHIHSKLQLTEMVKSLSLHSNARLLAEQVDNDADLKKAQDFDFDYYQGLYYGIPPVLRKEVNLSWTPVGKLYNMLSMPNASKRKYEPCVRMLMKSPVLRHLYFGRTILPGDGLDEENLIRESLTHIGIDKMRKWSCLLILRLMNVTESLRLPKKAYCRGLFIEQMIQFSAFGLVPSNGFYLGAFSLLDEITDTPLDDLLCQLMLDDELKQVLIHGEKNIYSSFLEYAVYYEENSAVPIINGLPFELSLETLNETYASCQKETERAFSARNPFPIRGLRM